MDDDGAPGERWAALTGALDPVENLRVIGEIQKVGLDAASRLLARFGDANPGRENGERAPLFGAERNGDADADAPNDLRNVRAGAERFIDLMAEATKRFVDAGVGLMAEPARPAEGRVVIAMLDGVGTAEVTIPSPATAVTVGDLRRHDGTTLAGACVRSRVLGTTSDSTRLVLRVDAPPDAEAGSYHGVGVAEGLHDFSLPVTVHIGEP